MQSFLDNGGVQILAHHAACLMREAEAAIAQLGERQTEDLEVLGSIPSPGMCFWDTTLPRQ